MLRSMATLWLGFLMMAAVALPAPTARGDDERVDLLLVLAALNSMGTIEITPTLISDALGWVLVAISAAAFYWLIFGKGWTADERKRSIAILVLFVAEAIFWASFEQAGSSLNLFGERNTNRIVFGYQFPASWFQSVQPQGRRSD